MASSKKQNKQEHRSYEEREKAHKAAEEKFVKVWAKIIAKAWSDELFKHKLFSRPAEVFKEFGVNVPAGLTLKVLEDSETVEYLIFPKKPEGVFSEEDLKKIAGGRAAPQTSQSVIER